MKMVYACDEWGLMLGEGKLCLWSNFPGAKFAWGTKASLGRPARPSWGLCDVDKDLGRLGIGSGSPGRNSGPSRQDCSSSAPMSCPSSREGHPPNLEEGQRTSHGRVGLPSRCDHRSVCGVRCPQACGSACLLWAGVLRWRSAADIRQRSRWRQGRPLRRWEEPYINLAGID